MKTPEAGGMVDPGEEGEVCEGSTWVGGRGRSGWLGWLESLTNPSLFGGG